MDLANGKRERNQAIIQKRKSEEEELKGSSQAKGLPVLGSAVVALITGGSLVLSLAGELALAGEFSLAGERSLARDSTLGSVVEADGASGAASGPSW